MRVIGGLGQAEGTGVWPDHADAMRAFLVVSTQWRMASLALGMAGGRLIAIGLDYGGVRAGLELAEIAVTPGLWASLRQIEAGAVTAMNEARR